MKSMRVLTTSESDEWLGVLRRSVQHDFYFLPGYHAMAERRGEGSAALFVFEEDGFMLALPLLIRSLTGSPELGSDADGWHDATSVYGYAGPISSHAEVPESVTRAFHRALREALLERRVIAAFSRLHPLIPQTDLLAGLGECRSGGQTVSIDLALAPEQQRTQYRSALRTRLNKLRNLGITGELDPERKHLWDFVSLYHENMHRVHAAEVYFFEADYFQQLASELGDGFRLFVVKWHSEILAAGVFTICDGLVQYHLGGTRDEYLKLSPMSLLLDSVRLWANEQDARIYHIGGGVGSKEDSLFHFKAGFSHRRHGFATWRWVIAPEIYQRLCEARRRSDAERGVEPVSSDYFPAYRCLSAPRNDAAEAALSTP